MARPASRTLAIIVLCASWVGAQSPQLTPEQWKADLRLLARELPRRHAQPWHQTTQQQFERAVLALEADLPRLNRAQTIARMAELVASIGDAHTYLDLPESPEYPVRFRVFDDGVFVTHASAAHSALVGHRVEAITPMDIASVLDSLRRVVSKDNGATFRFLVASRLRSAELLYGLGITPTADRLTLRTVNPQGQRGATELHATLEKQNFTENGGQTAPRYLASPNRNYWHEYLADSGTLYVRIRRSVDQEGESLEEFSRSLGGELARTAAPRLIIDLRGNVGGNSRSTEPILAGILGHSRLTRQGAVFVFLDGGTISAATVLAVELTNHIPAIVAGEPSGSSPNQYGENHFFSLPQSGLRVSYASLFFQTAGPFETHDAIYPELFVPLDSASYFGGRDPVLDAALTYVEPAPLLALLESAYQKGGLAAAIEEYRKFRSSQVNRFIDTERDLRLLGRRAAQGGKLEDALTVAEISRKEYPQRVRPYLVSADLYQQMGDPQRARELLLQARGLLPSDSSLYRGLRLRLEEIIAAELEKLPPR